MEMAKGKHP